jgi:hypothetical protein
MSDKLTLQIRMKLKENRLTNRDVSVTEKWCSVSEGLNIYVETKKQQYKGTVKEIVQQVFDDSSHSWTAVMVDGYCLSKAETVSEEK